MRICLLTYEFPTGLDVPVVSGEIKNPFYLARALAARGHELSIVSVPFLTRSVRRPTLRPLSDPPVVDVPDGAMRSVVRYRLRIRNLERFLAHGPGGQAFDVVHAEAPALAAAALQARRRSRPQTWVPVVTTAHGTYVPEARADAVSGSIRDRLRSASSRLSFGMDAAAFRFSDAVVAASKFQRSEMIDVYGVSPEKVTVIYNGVDLALYTPAGPRAAIPNLGGDSKVVLFVGRLVAKKGLQILMEAFPRVAEQIPGARCIVVGGSAIFDSYGDRLKALAHRQGLDHSFIWRTDVPEADMPSVYRLADVAAFPSLGYESLPTVVLEAMACGIPVVATDAWGTPEALGSGHPGLIAEGSPDSLAAALIELLGHPDAASAAAERQLLSVGRFSLDACARNHEELYKRVSSGH